MSKFGKGLFQLGDPLASFQSGFLTAEGLRRRGAGHKKKDSGSGAAAAGDAIHAVVQAEYAIRGNLAGAEVPLLDSKHGLVSRIDMVTRTGEVVEIKTVSVSELFMLREPRPDHKAQLIYYLNATSSESSKSGVLLYIAREAPGMRKAFRVTVDGDSEELSSASLQYMMGRRGPQSPSKTGYALKSAIEDYRAPGWFVDNYDELVAEEKRLRRQRFLSLKKKAFTRAYKQAVMGLSEEPLLDSHGFGNGPLARALRHTMTDFGSPWIKKEQWRDELLAGVEDTRLRTKIGGILDDPSGPHSRRRLGRALQFLEAQGVGFYETSLGGAWGRETEVRFLKAHGVPVSSPLSLLGLSSSRASMPVAGRRPVSTGTTMPVVAARPSRMLDLPSSSMMQFRETLFEKGIMGSPRSDMVRLIRTRNQDGALDLFRDHLTGDKVIRPGDTSPAPLQRLQSLFESHHPDRELSPLLENRAFLGQLMDESLQVSSSGKGKVERHSLSQLDKAQRQWRKKQRREQAKLQEEVRQAGDQKQAQKQVESKGKKSKRMRRALSRLGRSMDQARGRAAELARFLPLSGGELSEQFSGLLGDYSTLKTSGGSPTGYDRMEARYQAAIWDKLKGPGMDLAKEDAARLLYEGPGDENWLGRQLRSSLQEDLRSGRLADKPQLARLAYNKPQELTAALKGQDSFWGGFLGREEAHRVYEEGAERRASIQAPIRAEKRRERRIAIRDKQFRGRQVTGLPGILRRADVTPQPADQLKPKSPALRPASALQATGEIGFDTEFLVDKSGTRTRMTELTLFPSLGADSVHQIPEGLTPEQLRSEIHRGNQRALSRSTLLRSKYLDLTAIQDTLGILEGNRGRDVPRALREAGLIGKGDWDYISGMAERAEQSPKQFLMGELQREIDGVSTVVQKGPLKDQRVFLDKYAAQLGGNGSRASARSALATGSVGEYFRSRGQMVENTLEALSRYGEEVGDGYIYGHNVTEADLRLLQNEAFLHGQDLQVSDGKLRAGNKTWGVVDTMDGANARRFQGLVQESGYSAEGLDLGTMKGKVDGRGYGNLGNRAQAMGLVSAQAVEDLAHYPATDTMMNRGVLAVQLRGGEAIAGETREAFGHMVSEGKAPAGYGQERLAGQEVLEKMKVGEIQERFLGEDRKMGRSPVPKPRPGFYARSRPIISAAMDGLLGEGHLAATEQVFRAAEQGVSGVVDRVKGPLNQFSSKASTFFREMGIEPKVSFKGKALGWVGGAFLTAGLLLPIATSSIIPEAPTRPLMPRKKKITRRSLSADDEEHRLEDYTGPQAQALRHGMTDFGSGYKGVVGSGLAHLTGNVMSRSPLTREVLLMGQKEAQQILAAGSRTSIVSEGVGKAGMTAAREARKELSILNPIQAHGGAQVPTKARPPQVAEVRTPESPGTYRALKESEGMHHGKIVEQKERVKRQVRFRQRAGLGTSPIFVNNHNRTGHHRM